MQKIMSHWLEIPAVSGFHIGNIDLLIENESNIEKVTPDVDATIDILRKLTENSDDERYDR